jgi:DNA repair exonuclease SbcCD ATPase subunit
MTLQSFLKRSANRAAFEADKLQRTVKIQNAIGRLRTQICSETLKLGQTALRLYREAGLAEAELQDIAQAIETLEEQIAAREAELAQIKAENPPEPVEKTPLKQQPAGEGQFCPQCGQALPLEMRFCVRCGCKLSA